jgi:osmotically-inducible protein OsmY
MSTIEMHEELNQRHRRVLGTKAGTKRFHALVAAFILAAALPGCATIEKCGLEGCASDRKITAKVEALLNAHPEFGPPGTITVQTLNGVVYLDGELDDGLDRADVRSIVRRVAGVKKVVNGTYVDNN